MTLQEIKDILQTYTVPGWELTRWGGTRDGGYILFSECAKMSDVLYTYGIGHSTTFETEYCNTTGNSAFAFDHTVRRLPHAHESINFVKEGVAGSKRDKMDSYENHYMKYGGNAPLLKIDIEGWEYEVLDAIPQDLLAKSPIILLEVHDLNTRLTDFVRIIEKINQDFALVHIHPNNWGTTFNLDGHEFPEVLELSFVNKNFVPSLEKTVLSLPIPGIDRKNHSRRPDIYINYLYENSI
jgi:FkbM family methyltransferase